MEYRDFYESTWHEHCHAFDASSCVRRLVFIPCRRYNNLLNINSLKRWYLANVVNDVRRDVNFDSERPKWMETEVVERLLKLTGKHDYFYTPRERSFCQKY